MPNHVVNEIRLHNVNEDAVKVIVAGEVSVVDFETLLPLPLNFWPGNVSEEHKKAFPGNHLDAARDTWGTKWNAYALTDQSVCKDGNDVVLIFKTAWSPPRGWVVALFSKLKCDITHYWHSEGSDDVTVEIYIFDTIQWTSENVEQGCPDHRRLYKLQWGVETPQELESM